MHAPFSSVLKKMYSQVKVEGGEMQAKYLRETVKV
jgi:hypothetical protein